MAFRPNCGRPFDHPRWADGDPLARAFIMEMKDDLREYLTNMNAFIHGKGTSFEGTLLDGHHRKKYEKIYNRLLVNNYNFLPFRSHNPKLSNLLN